jgi:D-methionine transport system permease protein
VSDNTLEALKSMGASGWTIVRIVFKEALSPLVSGFTLTLVTLVGFMSAAAVIGAGGLAFLAYENGKFGNNYTLMYLSIFTILLLVFIIQITGDYVSKKLNHQ